MEGGGGGGAGAADPGPAAPRNIGRMYIHPDRRKFIYGEGKARDEERPVTVLQEDLGLPMDFSGKQSWREEAVAKAREVRAEEAAQGLGVNAIPLGPRKGENGEPVEEREWEVDHSPDTPEVTDDEGDEGEGRASSPTAHPPTASTDEKPASPKGGREGGGREASDDDDWRNAAYARGRSRSRSRSRGRGRSRSSSPGSPSPPRHQTKQGRGRGRGYQAAQPAAAAASGPAGMPAVPTPMAPNPMLGAMNPMAVMAMMQANAVRMQMAQNQAAMAHGNYAQAQFNAGAQGVCPSFASSGWCGNGIKCPFRHQR